MVRIFIIFSMIISLCVPWGLYSQDGSSEKGSSSRAKITGTVTDAATGNALPGANIMLAGTSIGAASDNKGEFIIYNVPPGAYTLKVRYIGYRETESKIQLTPGQNLEVNIAMNYEVIQGEVVVVTAQARGQMEAINQQLAARSITNIVASDRIREVPDVNAAESIGRLPGVSLQRSGGEGNKVVVRGLSPQYSIVQIDGVRLTGVDLDRSVGLSTITSEMLDGIELSKSLTPDKDADAIGGVVNLRTRVAKEGLHYEILSQGGYNDLERSAKNYKFAGTIGNRFFENKIGTLFNIGVEQVLRSSDRFEASYEPDITVLANELYTTSARVRERKALRKRRFGSLVLDYKTDFMSIKFNNIYNQMTNENEQRNNEFRFNENDFRFFIFEDNPNEVIRSHSLASTFNIFNTKLDIDLAYSNTKLDNQNDNYEFQDKYVTNVPSIAEDKKLFAQPSDLIDTYFDISSIATSYLYTVNRDTIKRRDETSTAAINWKVPFMFHEKILGNIKVGFKYNQKERSSDRERHETYYHGGIGMNRATRVVDNVFPELLGASDIPGYPASVGIPGINFWDSDYDYGKILNGRYKLGWSADLKRLQQVHNQSLYPEDQWYRQGVESHDDDYSNQERLMAGYVMAEINIGKKLMILPGVRYEYMQTEYAANYIFEDEFAQDGLQIGYPLPISVGDRHNEHWFPSVNTKFDVNNWFNIRAAYYRSCSRPDYLYLSPGLVSNNQQTRLTAQNPFLLPSLAQNYDVGFSFFQNKLGLLSFNAFYKEISDLIYRIPDYRPQYFDAVTDAPKSLMESLQNPRQLYYDDLIGRATIIDNYPINSPNKAYFRGFEVSWQTNFWYLNNPILRGIVLNLNYSMIWSQTKFPYLDIVTTWTDDFIPKAIITPYYRTRSGQMLDQPAMLFNAVVGWAYKGFSSYLSFRYQGETINRIDPLHSLLDGRTADLLLVDLSLKQKISKSLSVSLDIVNLTNSVEDSYYHVGDLKMPRTSDFYGLTSQLGLRYQY